MDQKSTRWWDWLAAILVLALLLTSVGRLGITRWTSDLDTVQRLAVIGGLLGLALGFSRFERRGTIVLALGYSLTMIPWQLALILSGDISALWERLATLGGRLWFSLGEFAASRPVEDTIFFVALLGLVYWTIGLCAGYWLTRHAGFLAIVLPAGIILLIVQLYDPIPAARVWFAGFYLFLCLMLLARMNYLREQVTRRERRVFVNPESSLDLNNGALIAAALLVLAAWNLPSALSRVQGITDTWDRVSEPWRQLRDRLSDAFAALEGSGGIGVEMYGDQLALGTGSVLGDKILFEITIQSASRDVPRYYWRGRTYDTYENFQWGTSATLQEPFDPQDGNVPIPDG
jgi:hypothetical protein